MNRRAFLASVGGLAMTPGQQVSLAPTPPLDTSRSAAEGVSTTPAQSDFAVWREGFQARAEAAGVSPEIVRTALADLAPDPAVLAQDRRQPEFSKPISDYLAGAVSDARVDEGRARWADAAGWLDPGAVGYGAPSEILVAIWGVESGFGHIQGDHDVMRALATLAFQGRRGPWAEGQLIAALRILATGAATRGQLVGSWAGAMGQMQFTPEDYLAYAVDADGDGRRDVWRSAPDALLSAANFLQRKAAWRPGQAWAREVVVPRAGFDYGLVEGAAQPFAAWRSAGVELAASAPLAAADLETPAQLLMPMGWRGPGFLAFPNHAAIRVYNNSLSYALAVGLLADRLAGRGPLVQPWPADAPSSLAERIGAQTALARAGFDPGAPDGVLGAGTRRAARGWQAARGLPADGYLSHDLIVQLNAADPTSGSGSGSGSGPGSGAGAPSISEPARVGGLEPRRRLAVNSRFAAA